MYIVPKSIYSSILQRANINEEDSLEKLNIHQANFFDLKDGGNMSAINTAGKIPPKVYKETVREYKAHEEPTNIPSHFQNLSSHKRDTNLTPYVSSPNPDQSHGTVIDFNTQSGTDENLFGRTTNNHNSSNNNHDTQKERNFNGEFHPQKASTPTRNLISSDVDKEEQDSWWWNEEPMQPAVINTSMQTVPGPIVADTSTQAVLTPVLRSQNTQTSNIPSSMVQQANVHNKSFGQQTDVHNKSFGQQTNIPTRSNEQQLRFHDIVQNRSIGQQAYIPSNNIDFEQQADITPYEYTKKSKDFPPRLSTKSIKRNKRNFPKKWPLPAKTINIGDFTENRPSSSTTQNITPTQKIVQTVTPMDQVEYLQNVKETIPPFDNNSQLNWDEKMVLKEDIFSEPKDKIRQIQTKTATKKKQPIKVITVTKLKKSKMINDYTRKLTSKKKSAKTGKIVQSHPRKRKMVVEKVAPAKVQILDETDENDIGRSWVE